LTIYLLDTNVLSEVRSARPDPKVVSWLAALDAASIRISVLTLGEIEKGITALRRRGNEAKANTLQQWFDSLPADYRRRAVPVDEAVALCWGRLAGTHHALPPIDGLLAATALVNGYTLVTRNVRDVAVTGVSTFNPWS